jgi:hypothetical protein
MDVALLARMVAELIADHDQVGLPGVGTFVAEVVPATFSDKGYTINPPYRRLSFHPSRTEDRLLTDFYAASNGITKEAAETYLTQFLQELKTVLKERKTIVLPGLGRLRATVENNFFFVPDADLDIFPDGFALKPLSLKTITESAEPVEIPIRPMEEREAEAAEPQPEEPQTEPELQPAAEPEQEPGPELEEPEIVPIAAEPDAAAEPEPTTEAAPTASPAPEPIAEPESEQAPEPIAEPIAEPTAAPVPEAGPEPASRPRRFRWWIPLLVLLVLAAVALLAFIIVAQVAPDIVDSILYTPEELRIINY